MNKTLLFVGIAIVMMALIGAFMYISVSNSEVRARNLVINQQDVCEANFDKMYKTIVDLAQIPERFLEKSKEAFKEIYPELMTGRYQNDRGGALMSWVTENNPQFDMDAVGKLYERLAIAIESNRAEFFMEQKKLISYKNTHDNIIMTIPGSILLKGRNNVEIIVITSSHTEEVYSTGKDDNFELF